MYLINVAVELLTIDRALGILLNKDDVVVLEIDLVTAIAFLMVIIEDSVIDKRIR
jgi:hypothetical protein